MGNNNSSNSTTIIQYFGTTNIETTVFQDIDIPGSDDYPKNDLQAQLKWIDNSALDYLTKTWTEHFSYIWEQDLTAPDGAVTHRAIQGTAWIDKDTPISKYLQVRHLIPSFILKIFC